MSRIKNWVCRTIVIVAMLAGIALTPEATFAQCTNETPNNVLRVDVNTQADPQDQDGRSWDCAFDDMQDAIDQIELNPNFDEIWVAAGTYTPSVEYDVEGRSQTGARLRTFVIPAGVELLGGFDGTESAASQADPANNVTILSGDLGQNGKCYHVLVIEHDNPTHALTSTVVNGFTISDGSADGRDENAIGGAAWLREENGTGGFNGGGAVFRRCIFEDNYAEDGGGAIFGYRMGVTIRDCIFRDNVVDGSVITVAGLPGGGAVNVHGKIIVANSRFESNMSSSGNGGALVHSSGNVEGSVFANCDFRANTAAFNGGAALLPDTNESSIAYIINCVFAGNVAEGGDGGGVWAENQKTGTVTRKPGQSPIY